jgi:hypothetical protein
VEDEGGKYSIGDSGEVRSRRKMKLGDIDLIAFRRSEGFGDRFFDFVGN